MKNRKRGSKAKKKLNHSCMQCFQWTKDAHQMYIGQRMHIWIKKFFRGRRLKVLARNNRKFNGVLKYFQEYHFFHEFLNKIPPNSILKIEVGMKEFFKKKILWALSYPGTLSWGFAVVRYRFGSVAGFRLLACTYILVRLLDCNTNELLNYKEI